jgi:hypothetical protein
MNARVSFHSVASDHQRGALVRMAASKGLQQAHGDFFHALFTEGVDDASLSYWADDAWETYARHIEFDYPRFAQALFLQAYRLAYRAHLLDLATGRHQSMTEIVAAIEAEIGLTSA